MLQYSYLLKVHTPYQWYIAFTMTKHTYTDDNLKHAIQNCFSIRETLIFLGLNPKGGGGYKTIHNKIMLLNIDTSHFKGKAWNKGKKFGPKNDINLYLNNIKPIQSFKLKNKLLKERIMKPICSCCNGAEWLGKPIPLELDHINGQHCDNSLSNLRLICPNCHAFTENYRGKNKGKAKYSL